MIMCWLDDSRVEDLRQVTEYMSGLNCVWMDQGSLVYKPGHRGNVYLAGSESEFLIYIETIGRFEAQVEACIIQKDQARLERYMDWVVYSLDVHYAG